MDLADLPERQRAALILRELNGLSHVEIGEVLGISTAAVKQAIFDARSALLGFREGRETACDDIRRMLSDGDGRVLRGRGVRGHLRACPDCRRFRADLERRPVALRALIPPLPVGGAAALLAQIIGGGTAVKLIACIALGRRRRSDAGHRDARRPQRRAPCGTGGRGPPEAEAAADAEAGGGAGGDAHAAVRGRVGERADGGCGGARRRPGRRRRHGQRRRRHTPRRRCAAARRPARRRRRTAAPPEPERRRANGRRRPRPGGRDTRGGQAATTGRTRAAGATATPRGRPGRTAAAPRRRPGPCALTAPVARSHARAARARSHRGRAARATRALRATAAAPRVRNAPASCPPSAATPRPRAPLGVPAPASGGSSSRRVERRRHAAGAGPVRITGTADHTIAPTWRVECG